MSGSQQTSNIIAPHEHDVLSGRGNFVNYHAGNEHFRALVRKHKLDYVQCPKPQKGKFSKMIYDEIRARNPPGRFLKQDDQTKLWYDIGEKKALDKTRQALREGAPEIVKEITEDNSDDDDPPRMVQKDTMSRRGSAPPAFSRSSDTPLQFMGSSGLQSPTMTRNLLTSPGGLASPGMVSPGLLLGGLSPDMGQFSARSLGGMGRMVDPSSLPGPPLQTQFDNMNMNQLDHRIPVGNLSGGLMMNQQMGNNFGNNMVSPVGMMSPQHIQLQNQINSQQVAMSQLNQQLQLQQQQMNTNQSDYAELQMLQNKLQSMRQTLHAQNMAAAQNMYQNSNHSQFESSQGIDHMPPPQPVHSDSSRSSPAMSTLKQQQSQSNKQRVDTLPGNNPRRMPPPSLLKKEGSLKMDKIFMGTSPQSAKKKYDANGSSAHLSAMSLSIGDMQEEGNLSSVFDSSLRISGDKHGAETGLNPGSKEKLKDRSTGHWDPNSLEMSVNTIGTGTGSEMRMEVGGMSYATLGDHNLQESDGNMSFGKVFEDPDRD